MMDWLLVLVRRRTHSDAGVRHGVPRTLARCEAGRPGPWRRTPSRRAPAAPADDAAEVLEYLRRLEAQGSPGLAADVIEIFLQDTSNRLTALRHAIAKEDGETVFRVAHTHAGQRVDDRCRVSGAQLQRPGEKRTRRVVRSM